MDPNGGRSDPDDERVDVEPSTATHAQSPALGEAVQLDPAETLEADPGDEPLDSG